MTKGSIVAVVDTSKSAIDVERRHEGTVYELITHPDETMPVGTMMPLFPAFGNGPMATIVQDVFSLLIYFATVTLLLP